MGTVVDGDAEWAVDAAIAEAGSEDPSPEGHPDLEYSVDDASGEERIFKTFDAAAAFAMGLACSRGEATLDVLVWSEAGARAFGGDDAVEEYREDPEASVHQRWEIRANCVGRVA